MAYAEQNSETEYIKVAIRNNSFQDFCTNIKQQKNRQEAGSSNASAPCGTTLERLLKNNV